MNSKKTGAARNRVVSKKWKKALRLLPSVAPAVVNLRSKRNGMISEISRPRKTEDFLKIVVSTAEASSK